MDNWEQYFTPWPHKITEEMIRESKVWKAAERVTMLGAIIGENWPPEECYAKCKEWSDENLDAISGEFKFTEYLLPESKMGYIGKSKQDG